MADGSTDWPAIISAATPVLVALIGVYQWQQNIKIQREIKKNVVATEELHESTNSRMDQLIEMNKAASKAEGVEQERQRTPAAALAPTIIVVPQGGPGPTASDFKAAAEPPAPIAAQAVEAVAAKLKE